jgi:hypothetical protein
MSLWDAMLLQGLVVINVYHTWGYVWGCINCWTHLGVKMVWIFSDRIRDRIRLEGYRSVRVRVWIFNIWYRIRIRILKSHIYDVNIQLYPIRHGWHYPYSNPNPDRNLKTNVISDISVHIRSVFIPRHISWFIWLTYIYMRFKLMLNELVV